MAEDTDFRLEWVPLSDAVRHPRNPKDHDEALIRASVLRFGFNDPIAVNEATGELLEGHGRLAVLQKMKDDGDPPPDRVNVRDDGEWLIPFLRGLCFDDPKEAEAYMIAHNRASESGGWVDTMLGQMLADFDTSDEALWSAIGFSQRDMNLLLNAEQAQDVARSLNVAERLDTYLAGEIKQIVLYFTPADYEAALTKLSEVMERRGLTNHTEVVLWLLDAFDRT